MGFPPIRSADSKFLERISALPAFLLRLGITARLTVFLMAVAVLAGTANMLARESAHIVRTVSHSAGNDSARLAAADWLKSTQRANAFTTALDRYGEAARALADGDSPTTQTRFLGAKDSLQLATLDYKNASQGEMNSGTEAVRAVPDYLDLGHTLVDLADKRRQLRSEYADLVQTIDDRVKGAQKHAPKIFGRVIARQSLLDLRAALDEVRQHSNANISKSLAQNGANAARTAAEARFSATLRSNQADLSSAEGPAWVQEIWSDFDQLASLSGSLTEVDERHDRLLRQLAEKGQSLSKAVAAAYSAPGAEIPQSLPSAETVTETTIQGTDFDAPRIMATVTAVVMALIVVISILTVRSILVPVRRLLVASNRLARGEVGLKVPRGGMKELDLVAEAFNEMSSQLQTAKSASLDHQENLEKKILERTHRLQQLAQQDPLTKLPNRRHLSALLNSAIERATRDHRYLGVYFIDIDNFKNINDSLGHLFGDRVLMSVANRLEELTDGMGFVARLGGDEFTVVYQNAESVHAIHELGWTLARAFQTLIAVDDRELSVSISVGASIYPDHESGAEELLRAADSALFRAKELGRSRLAVFTPELITTAAQRFSVEQGLRRAIENSEFELMYQPEIKVATLAVDRVEALLRWRLPDGRLVGPGEFLAVAEQSGLMAEINLWVLRAAIEDASRWYHNDWPDTRVAVNISARQLLDHRFVERLIALLREFRLPAKCVELELTEMVLQTGASTVAALWALQSHGFDIALDDFGTGYSSLTSLEQLPLSRIKLDRGLVSSIDKSDRSAAIANAVMDLCAGLGLQVTAEGIERPEQLAWLVRRRSILLQGFLLSEAIPFSEVLQVNRSMPSKVQDILLSASVPPTRVVANPRGVTSFAKAR